MATVSGKTISAKAIDEAKVITGLKPGEGEEVRHKHEFPHLINTLESSFSSDKKTFGKKRCPGSIAIPSAKTPTFALNNQSI